MSRPRTLPLDPILRAMYTAHRQKRINIRNKNQVWDLSFEDFVLAWEKVWSKRGINTGNYMLTRKDPSKAWTKDNVITLERAKGNNPNMGSHSLYSTDEERQQHLDYARMKAQAKFRQEPFDLTFEEFIALWADKWEYRGRRSDCYCLTRENPSLPWDTNNTILITRREQLATKFQKKWHYND